MGGNQMINVLKQSLELKNPVVPAFGSKEALNSSGGPLAGIVANLWQALVILGGLAVLLYFLWGGIDWIMAEGDPEKAGNARRKMIGAVMGLAFLVMTFAIITFLEWIFGFDILNVQWPNLISK